MNSTIAGNRPDPRIRTAQLDQLLNTYQTVVQKHFGTLTFLAGDEGSGRSATLNAFCQTLREQTNPRPKVVAVSFADGTYTPTNPERQNYTNTITFVGGLLGLPAALMGSPVAGVLGLVAQLIEVGAVSVEATREVVQKTLSVQGNPALLLKQALRQATEQTPVVCLIERIDRANAQFLTTFLISSLPDLITNRPPLYRRQLDRSRSARATRRRRAARPVRGTQSCRASPC